MLMRYRGKVRPTTKVLSKAKVQPGAGLVCRENGELGHVVAFTICCDGETYRLEVEEETARRALWLLARLKEKTT